MITRALEDTEIKAIFENVSGYNAKRNETLLIAVESHGVAEGYACVLHHFSFRGRAVI